MASEETLSPAPPLFPLGRVAPIRALTDINPRFVSVQESKSVQSVLNEELGLIGGIEKSPGENPEVRKYMDLMSAHCDIGEGLSVPALRVGMIFLYHTARLHGDALGTPVPTISGDQLDDYFKSRRMAVEDEKLVQYGLEDPWIPAIIQFRDTEQGLMDALKPKRSTSPAYASFELGTALMWDFLKTAPTL